MKCRFVSENGKKCLRRALKGKDRCKVHDIFDKKCPICLMEDEDFVDDEVAPSWFLLSCAHFVHEDCLKGMNKEECPLCRAPVLNLTKKLKESIRKNNQQYQEEQYQEERQEILNEIERQTAMVPPQLAFILAFKYLCELGISPYLLPRNINLRLDPGSPPPCSEFIFQETVAYVFSQIRARLAEDDVIPEEDDLCSISEEVCEGVCEGCGCPLSDHDGSGSSEDEDEPFRLEGADLRTIRTIPMAPGDGSGGRRRAYVPRSVFNTMTVDLSNLPPMSSEEVASLSSTFYMDDSEMYDSEMD
jgi:hypothetical protein